MKRILILDDEPDIVEIVILILTEEGYEMKGIGNGAQLFSTIDSFKPDLILLDIMLGEYDGRELCVELKTNQLTKHLPIIMLSASHDMRNLNKAQCKPNDFISKPFDIEVLANRVKSQLE